MKKNEKRMILILLVILAVALVIFFTTKNNKNAEEVVQGETQQNQVEEKYVEVQEDGTKVNVSNKLNQTKTVSGYRFENIRFTEKNGETVLLADVTNTTKSETPLKSVDITLLNDQGKEIITIGGLVQAMQPGETTQFNTSMTLDYANTYDLVIKVVD